MGRGSYIAYSPEELAWIESHATLARGEAHVLFCKLFGRDDISRENFKALCNRKGWKTGRTGYYDKGRVPENKGKKMPYNANSARTQFKKGFRGGKASFNYKPIGFERVTIDGYVERKVNDDIPFNKRWRPVHMLNWEALNGPLPKGHCLKCLDGNKLNTDAANWACISRGELQALNSRWRNFDYDALSPEVKSSALLLAKLKYAKGKKARAGKSKESVDA